MRSEFEKMFADIIADSLTRHVITEAIKEAYVAGANDAKVMYSQRKEDFTPTSTQLAIRAGITDADTLAILYVKSKGLLP